LTENSGSLINIEMVKTMMGEELKDLNKKYEDNIRDLKLNNLLNLKKLESINDELIKSLNDNNNLTKEIEKLKDANKYYIDRADDLALKIFYDQNFKKWERI